MSDLPSPPSAPTTAVLRTVPLLSDVPENLLQVLAAAADWRKFPPGEVIARQNEYPDAVHFILSGFVKILRGGGFGEDALPGGKVEQRARSRHPVVVALIGAGDLVGEVGTLLGCGRCASIVALTPCDIVTVVAADFLSCMESHPPFAMAVARKTAHRLIETDRQVELMRGDLDDRIHFLMRQCKTLGLDIERWLTVGEIARMVGASRGATSTAINRLSRGRSGPA